MITNNRVDMFRCLAIIALIAAFLIPESASAATSPWQLTGSMKTARAFHTATLLPGGHVLVAGGADSTGKLLARAEVYHPATGAWTTTSSMSQVRANHSATPLPNGNVLVAGGTDINGNGQASAELYDPWTGAWTPTGSMSQARTEHVAFLLPTGDVLVAGGWAPPVRVTGSPTRRSTTPPPESGRQRGR